MKRLLPRINCLPILTTICFLFGPATPSFAAEISSNVSSLQYPSSWKISPGESGCSRLSAPTKPARDPFSLEVCLVEKDMEQAAYDSGIFDKSENGTWVTIAGQGSSQIAKHIGKATWTGIQAVIDCGIEDATGFHSVGGDCFWAIISDGHHSLIINTLGTYRDLRSLNKIVNSIRFK